MATSTENKVPDDLLAILVCPVDHAKVNPEGDFLVCAECGRAYPVRDGIPVMLVEEAEQRGAGSDEGQADAGRTPGAGTGRHRHRCPMACGAAQRSSSRSARLLKDWIATSPA